MKRLYKSIIFTFIFLFLMSSIAFATTTTNTTGLTSLALSNLYTSLSYDYAVLRITGVGDTIATLTLGYRQTFDFGYIYLGFGSIPGQSIDMSSSYWFSNVVWQAEVNINLKKAGEYLEKLSKQDNSNSNSTNIDNKSSK